MKKGKTDCNIKSTNFSKTLIFLNFIMLIILLSASDPILKLVEEIRTDHKAEARKELCEELIAYENKHYIYVGNIYRAGYSHSIQNLIRSSMNSEEEFDEWFEENKNNLEGDVDYHTNLYLSQNKGIKFIYNSMIETFNCY